MDLFQLAINNVASLTQQYQALPPGDRTYIEAFAKLVSADGRISINIRP
jgi:hypothetical protein